MNDDDLRAAFHRSVEGTSASHVFRIGLSWRLPSDAGTVTWRWQSAPAALSVLVVVGAFALTGNGKGAPAARRVSLADNSKVESTQSESTASALASGRPRQLVRAPVAGRLVTINGSSGQTEKVLTVIHDPDDSTKGGLLGHVTLSPDGAVVYFDVKVGAGCRNEVRTVSATGGGVTDVVVGSVPALDPTGGRLAYVRQSSCDDLAVVVRSLRDGAEHVVATRVADGPASTPACPGRPQATSSSPTCASPTRRSTGWRSSTAAPPSPSIRHPPCGHRSSRRPAPSSSTRRCSPTATCSSQSGAAPPTRPAPRPRRIGSSWSTPTASFQSIVAYGFLDRTHSSPPPTRPATTCSTCRAPTSWPPDGRARPTLLACSLLGAAWR